MLAGEGFPRVKTIYIGGGTPSFLPREDMAILLELVQEIGDKRGPVTETTMELNPEDVTPEMLNALDDAGVNRISLGIQTLNESHLRRLGRASSLKATVRGLDLVASRHGNWSADLMTGLPWGTSDKTLAVLEEILMRNPHHLSLYELSIEPATVLGRDLRRGHLVPRDSHDQDDEIFLVTKTLLERGFRHYEVSNFARPGKESRHNCGYWSMAPHLGVGPGAVGTVLEPGPVRHTNTRNIRTYLQASDFGLLREHLSPSDFLKELLMMGLRTDQGVSRAGIQRWSGMVLEELLPNTLAAWQIVPGEDLVLIPENRFLLDRFLRDAFAEIDCVLART